MWRPRWEEELRDNPRLFSRYILETFEDKTECIEAEAFVLDSLGAKSRSDFINQANGNAPASFFENHRKVYSKETNEKISQSLRKFFDKNPVPRGEDHPRFGRKHTEEWKKTRSERYSGEGHPNFGKKASDQARANISASKKGEKHPNFGKPRSEETKRKIAESNRRTKAAKKA